MAASCVKNAIAECSLESDRYSRVVLVVVERIVPRRRLKLGFPPSELSERFDVKAIALLSGCSSVRKTQ